MGNIAYRLHGGLYLNLTNQCPCNCDFCIRKNGTNVGTADDLWLKKEPTFDDILADLEEADVQEGEEITFCGYGEPTCALALLLRTAQYLKENYHAVLRINTNGLGSLVNGRNIVPELAQWIDIVSVSLNASDAEKYQAVVHSRYGLASYQEMLDFAAKAQAAGIEARFTVVDVIGAAEVEACRRVAQKVGVPLRVREFVKNNDGY